MADVAEPAREASNASAVDSPEQPADEKGREDNTATEHRKFA